MSFELIYRKANGTIAAIILYLFMLPLISPVMSRAIPGLWQCSYARVYERPCPFCHMTRDLGSLYRSNGTPTTNALTIPAVIVGLIQMVARVTLSISPGMTKKRAVLAEMTVLTMSMVVFVYHV